MAALDRKELSGPLCSLELGTSISPCIGTFKGKERLQKRHFEHYAASLCTTQPKLFIERPSSKLSWDITALERKQCRLVTGLLTGHCTFRRHLHIMSFLESATCRKCGQKKEPSYHIFC